MTEHTTRMGDGRVVRMSSEKIRAELETGTKEAADKAKIPELNGNELETLYEIVTNPSRIVGVEMGREAVMSADAGGFSLFMDSGSSGLGLPIERSLALGAITEKVLGIDIIQESEPDASFKAMKPISPYLMVVCQNILQSTISPLMHISMPNLGYFYKPDGPWDEPIGLLRDGKFDAAKASMEGAVQQCTESIVYVATHLATIGIDGINIDTIGAAGDPDFYSALLATEAIKKQNPELSIEFGMATESVHGFHAQLKYNGTRLAGLWPHQQVKLAEKAGADIFGPVINTKSQNSFSWNLARAVTFTKQCVKDSSIPVHVNMGMGVGGVPMFETPPVDAVTRANKAMIEVAGVDGV